MTAHILKGPHLHSHAEAFRKKQDKEVGEITSEPLPPTSGESNFQSYLDNDVKTGDGVQIIRWEPRQCAVVKLPFVRNIFFKNEATWFPK